MPASSPGKLWDKDLTPFSTYESIAIIFYALLFFFKIPSWIYCPRKGEKLRLRAFSSDLRRFSLPETPDKGTKKLDTKRHKVQKTATF